MTSLSTAPDRFSTPLSASPVVFVVGGDMSLCWAVDAVAQHAGWRTEAITSVTALMARRRTLVPSCLVLDLSGLESDDHLGPQWPTVMPVICITPAADVPLSVRAMKAGAADVLTRPISEASLFEVLRLALDGNEHELREEVELDALRERYASLSGREREVMSLVVSGLMNKQVGWELGISEITVKAHRGRVMRKMKARSLASLVMFAARLGEIDASNRTVRPAAIGVRSVPPASFGPNPGL